jgi:hypothetical protein
MKAFINIETILGSIDNYNTDDFSGYIIDNITNPKKSSSKEDNSLWSFYSMVANPEKAYTGKVRRCSDNCSMIYALCLDYDGGVYLDGVHKKYKPYEHYIYTSFRHMDKEQKEKFRMILPLDKPYDCAIFRSSAVKDYLNKLFKGCDTSTFAVSRTFYMPAIDINNPSVYQHRINNGIKYSLNLDKIKEIIDEERKLLELKREQYKDEEDLTPLIRFQQNKLESVSKGNRNNEYWKSVYCLSQHGMDGSEIYNELKNYIDSDMDREFRAMCNRV